MDHTTFVREWDALAAEIASSGMPRDAARDLADDLIAPLLAFAVDWDAWVACQQQQIAATPA